jgi:hypothetical protein
LHKNWTPKSADDSGNVTNACIATDKQAVPRVEHFPVGIQTLFSSPSTFVE